MDSSSSSPSGAADPSPVADGGRHCSQKNGSSPLGTSVKSAKPAHLKWNQRSQPSHTTMSSLSAALQTHEYVMSSSASTYEVQRRPTFSNGRGDAADEAVARLARDLRVLLTQHARDGRELIVRRVVELVRIDLHHRRARPHEHQIRVLRAVHRRHDVARGEESDLLGEVVGGVDVDHSHIIEVHNAFWYILLYQILVFSVHF